MGLKIKCKSAQIFQGKTTGRSLLTYPLNGLIVHGHRLVYYWTLWALTLSFFKLAVVVGTMTLLENQYVMVICCGLQPSGPVVA